MEVIMMILTLFTNLPFGEGFGFNTNILETNIINLAVVLGVVISFVGDALKSLLDNRKQTIVKNLLEAEQRAIEAEEKLNKAQNQLQAAKQKAIEIREQGLLTAEQEKKLCIRQAEQDAKRLETLKYETLEFQQKKIINQISQQVVKLALNQVRDKLNTKLEKTFHTSVNNFNIVLFTNYKMK
uniref:ATP synthase subunit b, chloroplastic n=1 Tax=Interfilum terricola TaxID=163310 RepID=A0A097KPG6_9VIRI|nr:CF0 subunit I of ATP synthase [Interfilum terricola]AIT95072.1 CF0 subunit I of ATP synthase [Interfilum terricola]